MLLKIKSAYSLNKAEAIGDLKAGDLYHDRSQWSFTTPSAAKMRDLFSFEGQQPPLSETQFKDFYEKYIYPLFCYFYGTNGGLKAKLNGDEDKLFDQKDVFLNMIWILDNCLNKPGLKAGVRLIVKQN